MGLAAASLSACGGTPKDATVLRVGDRAISKATVDHWTDVIDRGGGFNGFRGAALHGSARQRAVALLITSNWLIGESARQGVPDTQEEAELALAEHERESGAVKKHLLATGETSADAELELRAELAAEAIRAKLAERADDVSQEDVLAFYRQQHAQFMAPEVRVTDLIEGQASPAAATALVSRTGSGKDFAKRSYHERVTRSPGFTRTLEKRMS
jgi:hypothetical protein